MSGTMTVEKRRQSTLPPELLSRLNCTYQMNGTLDRACGMRYLLKRSDGVGCNVSRSELLRIMRLGKLRDERGMEVRHV